MNVPWWFVLPVLTPVLIMSAALVLQRLELVALVPTSPPADGEHTVEVRDDR